MFIEGIYFLVVEISIIGSYFKFSHTTTPNIKISHGQNDI